MFAKFAVEPFANLLAKPVAAIGINSLVFLSEPPVNYCLECHVSCLFTSPCEID